MVKGGVYLFVGFFFVVVVPLQVGFGVLAAGIDEFLLFRAGDVEVDGADTEGVDIDGALPVVAVQVDVVLEVDEGSYQGFGVGKETGDFVSNCWGVGEVHRDVLLGIQTET